MTTRRGSADAQDTMRAGTQLWESGFQAMAEGMRQAQEFWTNMARNWGETAGAWMGQTRMPGAAEGMEAMRELQEAAFAVAQAWMRLPLVLMGGAQPDELQEAATRLTQAQGRAYQLWMDALTRMGSETRQ